MIGIFDSGLGGLTALKEIQRRYPHEDLVYFGDTGRVPYGTRSHDTIVKYAMQDMRFLLSHKPDAVVIACGTVSSTALEILRDNFDIPMTGVIEGASRKAVSLTKSGIIGVIGTAATIRSHAFERRIGELSPNSAVISCACPLFVPLVENGFISADDEVTRLVCERYLAPIRESGADTLILGCTHYPIIAGAIASVMPGIALVNTGAEAAAMLEGTPNLNRGSGSVRYFVSDDPAGFESTASLFLQTKTEISAEKIDIECW